MASLQNQTSINPNRYFFATKDDGEQELYTTTVAAGNLTDFYVGINGASGNQVQINQMPDIIGTTSVGGEEMVYAGTASTYKTLSSLSVTATGISLSSDRTPGTGIATIESYRSNGSTGGFEFLSRGTASELLSTPMDSYFTSIGRPGATAVLGASGSLVTGSTATATAIGSLSAQDSGPGTGCFTINDLSGGQARTRWSWYKYGFETGGNSGTNLALGAYSDGGTFIAAPITISRALAQVGQINQYNYPQAVVAVPPSAISPGAVTVGNATPTVILTIPSTGLVPGQNYLTDINISITATNPLAVPVFLQLGVRLGGNGAFNYENPITLLAGVGIPVVCAVSINQISDMGTTNNNIDIIAYQQSSAPGNITVTATTSSGSPPHLLKNIT